VLGTLDRAVARFVIAVSLSAIVTSFVIASPVRAQPVALFPGVTYENDVQFTPHGPVAIRVVRGPRPVGLYRLRPTLSNETVLGRETVSSMQRRLGAQATMVGVNGDLARISDGKPSGILLRDGVLVAPPNGERSSAGIALDGTLDVRRVKFFGTWRGTGQRRRLNDFNEEPAKNGVALFTSDWGRRTPSYPDGVAVVLAPSSVATPNVDLSAPVVNVIRGGAAPLAAGTSVLVARGTAASYLLADAQVGTTVVYRLILQPDWTAVPDAIGGGPVIVRDGKPVFRANEAFTTSQIAPRHPRTAVGQLADGRILMVVVDGRQPGYSVGMSTFEMAQAMVRLGAVRAMQLDSGGSSTLAFDGRVLNQPSDGRERPIATALMLQYFGVYVAPPAEEVVSPNGDSAAEEQRLSFKVVRPSTVTTTLTAPDGSIGFQESLPREPGSYAVAFPPPTAAPPVPPTEPAPPAEGRWTLTLSATDDQGLPSSATRRFWVNSTLGFLRITPTRLVLPPAGGSATIGWTQSRAARVRVTVETPEGVLIRTVAARRFEPGTPAVAWNGRLPSGKLAAGGRYVVRVRATNEVGTVDLSGPLAVRRTAKPKR
jgi:phosphodiester glycosidase/flagellar hook capping protein FlgD